MQDKYKHEDITRIQNTLWAMYKEFRENHSVKEWTAAGEALSQEYRGTQLQCYCENQLITWSQLINGLAEEFRKG